MHDAKPGDRVVAVGHRVGESAREGEVLEVLGTEGHQHLRVLWADGGESTVYAGADVRIEHVPRLR
jgi:Domain of unknown function (DUF1918)